MGGKYVMTFNPVKIFARLMALSASVCAATQERVFTLQGIAKSDAEAIAIAK